MSSSAKADPNANVTPRLKSAVLWGVVGALVFLVLHQAYLLMDGEFLGVGPVAAVAASVFVATVVASYFTAGHLEVFEPEDSTVEPPHTGAPEPANETESWSEPASETGSEPEPTTEPETATETESEPEPAPEQESESTTGSESAPEPDAPEPVADGSLGGGGADDGATDGESDEETADDSDDEWIWGDREE